MKLLTSIILGLSLLVAPVTFTGCVATSNSREAIVFYTFHDIQTAVHEAMNVFAERVVRGQATTSQQESVEKAYRDYQDAFRVAFALAQSDWKKPVPADVNRLSKILTDLIYSL